MSTSGNREWAYAEATRRANAMDKSYYIYQNKLHEGDYIIRPIEASFPDARWWRIVKTVNAERTIP